MFSRITMLSFFDSSLFFCLFLFLFLYYVAFRFLHSFPTRRSSDLLSVLAALTSVTVLAACSDDKQDAAPAAPAESSQSQTEDRKSTRLNSSHVAISYAVFCLKKKRR